MPRHCALLNGREQGSVQFRSTACNKLDGKLKHQAISMEPTSCNISLNICLATHGEQLLATCTTLKCTLNKAFGTLCVVLWGGLLDERFKSASPLKRITGAAEVPLYNSKHHLSAPLPYPSYDNAKDALTLTKIRSGNWISKKVFLQWYGRFPAF